MSARTGGHSNHHMWLASQEIRSVEELEMLYVVQGQRRHTMVRLEETGTEKVGVDSSP